MPTTATTINEYIDSLPEERKAAVTKLRKTIKANLPKGFEEVMSYGAIGYVVPHKLYPGGYHVTPELPLPFIGVASQKNHIAVYHMAMQGKLADWFREEWKIYSSKKLDMGKVCIRFRKPEDVPLELIGILAAKLTPKQWIDMYETTLKS